MSQVSRITQQALQGLCGGGPPHTPPDSAEGGRRTRPHKVEYVPTPDSVCPPQRSSRSSRGQGEAVAFTLDESTSSSPVVGGSSSALEALKKELAQVQEFARERHHRAEVLEDDMVALYSQLDKSREEMDGAEREIRRLKTLLDTQKREHDGRMAKCAIQVGNLQSQVDELIQKDTSGQLQKMQSRLSSLESQCDRALVTLQQAQQQSGLAGKGDPSLSSSREEASLDEVSQEVASLLHSLAETAATSQRRILRLEATVDKERTEHSSELSSLTLQVEKSKKVCRCLKRDLEKAVLQLEEQMNGEKERMEKASAQQAERITVLEKQCEEQQAARVQTEAEKKLLEEEVKRLHEEISEYNSTMEDSQKCLVKMEANITNLRQQLQGKEDTIRQLKKTVESYQARFVDKDALVQPPPRAPSPRPRLHGTPAGDSTSSEGVADRELILTETQEESLMPGGHTTTTSPSLPSATFSGPHRPKYKEQSVGMAPRLDVHPSPRSANSPAAPSVHGEDLQHLEETLTSLYSLIQGKCKIIHQLTQSLHSEEEEDQVSRIESQLQHLQRDLDALEEQYSKVKSRFLIGTIQAVQSERLSTRTRSPVPDSKRRLSMDSAGSDVEHPGKASPLTPSARANLSRSQELEVRERPLQSANAGTQGTDSGGHHSPAPDPQPPVFMSPPRYSHAFVLTPEPYQSGPHSAIERGELQQSLRADLFHLLSSSSPLSSAVAVGENWRGGASGAMPSKPPVVRPQESASTSKKTKKLSIKKKRGPPHSSSSRPVSAPVSHQSGAVPFSEQRRKSGKRTPRAGRGNGSRSETPQRLKSRTHARSAPKGRGRSRISSASGSVSQQKKGSDPVNQGSGDVQFPVSLSSLVSCRQVVPTGAPSSARAAASMDLQSVEDRLRLLEGSLQLLAGGGSGRGEAVGRPALVQGTPTPTKKRAPVAVVPPGRVRRRTTADQVHLTRAPSGPT